MQKPEDQGENCHHANPVNAPFRESGDSAPLSDLNADAMDQAGSVESGLAFAACAVESSSASGSTD